MTKTNPTSRALISLLVGFVFLFLPLTPAQADSLGIQVEIDVGSDPSNRSDSYRLWFTGEQGTSVTRTLRVAGLSETDQNIVVELYDKVSENGQVSTDFSKPSRFSEWLRVTPENAVLASGEIMEVDLTLDIPADAADQSFDGTIRVFSTDATPDEAALNPEARYRAAVSGGLAITLPFRLGVGAELVLAPTFEITGVEGVLIDDERYLRTFFRNQGSLPIILSGSLQLADQVFTDRAFGPYDFKTQEIGPGRLGFVDVPAEAAITEGDYQAYVIAEQLGVRENRVLDVYIEFLPPGTLKISDILPWAVAFVLAAVLLAIGLRLLRSGKSEPPQAQAVKRTPKIRPPKISRATKPAPETQRAEPVMQASPSVEELAAKLGIGQRQATATTEKPVKKRPARKNKLAPAPSSPPPPEVGDPWEFLRAGREGRWSETGSKPEDKVSS